MRVLYFKGLSDMDMVSNLYPISNSVLNYLFFFFVAYLFILFEGQDRVFFFKHRIGRRIEPIKWMLFKWGAIDGLIACSLFRVLITVLLIFFLELGADPWG